MKYQGLRQVFRVIEWKDGCIFRTQKVGYAWVDLDNFVPTHEEYQYHSLPTDVSMKLGIMKTMRKVSDDTPAIVNLDKLPE